MKIIDLYIVKKYLSTFFFITLALIFVMSLFNWLDMNDKFARANAPTSIILKYYFFNTTYFLNIVISICALLAALFTFSGLGKYNELTALRASGVSRFRAIFPVLVASLLISGSLLVLNEYVSVPFANKKDDIYNYDIFKKNPDPKIKNNIIQQLAKNTILQAESYDPAERKMVNATIQYFNDSLRVLKRVDASTIDWDSTKWVLKDVQLRERDLEKRVNFSYQKLATLTLPDLTFIPSDLEEKKFLAGRIERYLTLEELENYSAKLTSFAQPTFIVDYEIYNAILFPFAIFFMTFIGALLGSISNRGGTMIYFFICLLICLVYISIIVLGKIFGQANTISPLLGALLPHLVTSFVLFTLAFRR